MQIGICKVCGQKRKVDVCGYCNECYPYGNATDAYKRDVESDRGTCRHQFADKDTGWCGCGVYVRQQKTNAAEG